MPYSDRRPARQEPDVDVVVVGGGVAGLSAATWLARYRRSVLLVDAGEQRARRVESSHGYLGRDPQRPTELLAAGRSELLAYPTVTVCDDRVVGVRRREDGAFDVTLRTGRPALASRVVLACGVSDDPPPVSGFAEHYGASVFHCPACDGYEARDCDVVVLGWAEHLVGFATHLLGWAASVTVVTAGHRFAGDEDCRELLARHGVAVVEEPAAALVGVRGDLTGVRLASGLVLPAAQVFFSIGHRPRVELATGLGCRLDDEGYVTVNDCGETSVAGVYAAGDLVPGLQLTAVAAAKGVVAGVACAQSLFGEPGARTAPPPAPDVEAESG